MPSNASIKEAQAVLTLLTAGVLGSVPGVLISANGAGLRRQAGLINANAEAMIKSASLGQPLVDLFSAAVTLGATFTGMDAVRATMVAVVTRANEPAILIAHTGLKLALLSMVQIVAFTAYDSRDDIDAALDAIITGFEPAEEDAANGSDPALYQALVAARAACTRDLVERARPLPQIITVNTQQSAAVLTIANKLYGDADRSEELVRENRPVHPAFMPLSLRALAE